MSQVAPVIAVFAMRCTARAAISAGPTTRPMGSVARSWSRRASSWSPSSDADNGVSTKPAPIRVNLIAPGFVDTPLSASLLGEDLDKRRDQLRATLPIGRVVGPADVAMLAVHLMTNTAVTGATYDIDGGQQLVSG